MFGCLDESLDENKSFDAVLGHISDVGVATCAHVVVNHATAFLFCAESWAARYNTWPLIEMTPKGAVFSFIFFSSVLSEGSHASHGAGSNTPNGQVLVPVCAPGKQGAAVQRWGHDCVSDAPGCASAELQTR